MITNRVTQVPFVVAPSRSSHTALVVTVLDSRPLTPSTHLVRVHKPEGFEFPASSFVRMILNTEQGLEMRPMSIASAPTRDYIEWAVRVSETSFKQAFVSLKPGDQFHIEGPRGRFILQPEHPAIMLAGGIGITPFRSMIQYATDRQLATPITLIYSNRSYEEIAFKDELDALARANPNLKVIHTLTRYYDPGTWDGRLGRIDLELLRGISAEQDNARYYVCGTPSMVHDTIQLLWMLNIPQDRILQERFMGYAYRQ